MEKINLKQKLVNIRKSVEYIQKTESGNSGKYVDPAVLLQKIRSKMDELNVLLVPEITEAQHGKIKAPTKNNPENENFSCYMSMNYVWMDAESEEELRVPWAAVADNMKDSSYAFGGGLTYTERYFLLKFFNIPTSKDDPEFFEQKTAERITKEQIDKLCILVKEKGFPVDATLNKLAKTRYNLGNLNQLPESKFEDAYDFLNALEPKNDPGK